MGHIQIWHLFLIKLSQSILMTFKIEILNFMTKVNPHNGYKTKSDISPMNVFKSDITFIGCKILKHFNDFYN